LAVDLVAGAVFRALPVPRTAEAVAARRVLVVSAATDRFAAPAFAVPVGFTGVALTAVDLAVLFFGAAVLAVAARVPVLLVVVTPAARLAAGLVVVALFAAAIVFFPLVGDFR
jgi:hypothetical protein